MGRQHLYLLLLMMDGCKLCTFCQTGCRSKDVELFVLATSGPTELGDRLVELSLLCLMPLFRNLLWATTPRTNKLGQVYILSSTGNEISPAAWELGSDIRCDGCQLILLMQVSQQFQLNWYAVWEAGFFWWLLLHWSRFIFLVDEIKWRCAAGKVLSKIDMISCRTW